jgi:hypothetical protein
VAALTSSRNCLITFGSAGISTGMQSRRWIRETDTWQVGVLGLADVLLCCALPPLLPAGDAAAPEVVVFWAAFSAVWTILLSFWNSLCILDPRECRKCLWF